MATMLELVQKIQQLPPEGDVETILRDLARTSQADDAGVCTESIRGIQNHAAVCLGTPAAIRRFPWEDTSAWQAIRDSENDVAVHSNETGHWVLAAAWEPRTGQRCWVWLRRQPTTPWRADEVELLPYIAHSLVRWIGKRREFLATFQGQVVQQRLEHAAQITSKLSHDFGNLLTGIMGFTELSLMHLPAESPIRKHLTEVLGQAMEGAEWVRKLHRYCRRMQVSPTASTAILPVLAAESNRLEIEHGKGLKFEATLASQLPEARIDGDSLRILLAELLRNSAEAMKGSGTIRIAVRPVVLVDRDVNSLLGNAAAGSYVEIVIQDTGPGLSDEAHAKLFREIYYSSKPKRRGLGLLMVHGLLMTHQGGLHWEQLPGQGLKTRICLPIASPARRP